MTKREVSAHFRDFIWTTKDGRRLRVKEMDDWHVWNSRNYVARVAKRLLDSIVAAEMFDRILDDDDMLGIYDSCFHHDSQEYMRRQLKGAVEWMRIFTAEIMYREQDRSRFPAIEFKTPQELGLIQIEAEKTLNSSAGGQT